MALFRVDLDAQLVGHDEVDVDLLVAQGISLPSEVDELLDLVEVPVVRPLVEARVPSEELHVGASAVGGELHVEAAAHLEEEAAQPQVLRVHHVGHLVEDRLELAVEVSGEDEADAHQLPLRQLL